MTILKPYCEVRDDINTGDIIFFQTKGIVSKIIRFVTSSEYSHVGIAMWVEISGQKRLMVIEAQGNAHRRIVNAGYYQDFNVSVVKAPMPFLAYRDEALGYVGLQKYSMVGAIYVGLREFVMRRTKYTLPSYDAAGEICSEFVAKMLKFEDTNISPQLLFEALTKKSPK
jgi:hypothetical protein